MAVPTRDEALEILEEHHREISELIGGLSDEAFSRPGTIGGGDWSAKDLIAHIRSWETMALETIEDWRDQRYPRIHERFVGAGGVDGLNAQILDQHLSADPSDARRSFSDTYEELKHAMLQITAEEWDRPPFYEPPVPTQSMGDAIGRVLGSDAGPFAHAADHLDDLRSMVARASS